jgi:hypothetical protein
MISYFQALKYTFFVGKVGQNPIESFDVILYLMFICEWILGVLLYKMSIDSKLHIKINRY